MTKISVWKRMGGWFSRSQMPISDEEIVPLDAEGLIVDSTRNDCGAANGPGAAIFTRAGKKEQLVAMEDSFSRLVEVLEGLNDNVVKQREQGKELNEKLDTMLGATAAMPATLDKQAGFVKDICNELRNQSARSEQLAESVSEIPALAKTEIERLGDILQELESSTQSRHEVAGSLKTVNETMEAVSTKTGVQTSALYNVADLLGRSNKRIEEMLVGQRRRFWLMIAVIVAIVAGGIAAIWMIINNNASPGG